MDNRPVTVSIRCLVYNHAPYLRKCLDGFVSQKTNFRFQAVVHDDVSTDGSADIIREYAERYPDIIKPIYETENQFSKRHGVLDRIMAEACEGKYVAMCEGDDYWTDPHKLQKQVDFMEANPEYSICFHNAMTLYEGSDRPMELFSHIEPREYSLEEILEFWIIPTASVLFRRSVFDSELYSRVLDANLMFGDTPLYMTCASLGRAMGLTDVMSVYRRQPDGISARFDSARYHRMIDYHIGIAKLFGTDRICLQSTVRTSIDGFVHSARTKGERIDFSFLFAAIKADFPYLIRYLWDNLRRKFSKKG